MHASSEAWRRRKQQCWQAARGLGGWRMHVQAAVATVNHGLAPSGHMHPLVTMQKFDSPLYMWKKLKRQLGTSSSGTVQFEKTGS